MNILRMASNYHSKLLPLLFLLSSLLLVPTPSSADASPPTNLTSAWSICESAPDPNFCRSVLQPTYNITADGYFFGRYALQKSLSQSRKFLKLIDAYLAKRPSLSVAVIMALYDCRFLAGLNLEFLTASFQTVNSTSKTLPVLEADDVHTIMSATLTNELTCLDSLTDTASEWSSRLDIRASLANDTKLYSLSLALFSELWLPKVNRSIPSSMLMNSNALHKGFALRHGQLSFRMSEKSRAIYESAKSRRHIVPPVPEPEPFVNPITVYDVVLVEKDGTGNFTTINNAIKAAPIHTNITDGYFLIYVTQGVYEEYISIPKNKTYLMMMGDGINRTIITGNRSVVDGIWTTFNSSTFSVVAKDFVAAHLTFQNTAGAIKHQAVAVRNGADMSTFFSCSFEGYQDTLYAHSLRQFYRECDIYGTVDFIFGNAAVVFQECNLYPRLPMDRQFNAITAQGRTDPNQNTGTSIHDCTIRPADDLATTNQTVQTYLGRAWKQYSRTVYMQCYMDGFIDPVGWHDWNGTFALDTLYYAEYDNRGPGSNTTNRVTWPGYHVINAADAANFTVSNFILNGDIWLNHTGVPYIGGLL